MEEIRRLDTISRKIFDFYIPDTDVKYTVYETSRISGKSTYVGETDYNEKIIKIEMGSLKQMRLTLIHELMHVWLYEIKGITEQNFKFYTNEELCEYMAESYDFIYNILEENGGMYRYE